MPGLQKIKIFANANVVGLEREMNSWLRNTSPHPVIVKLQTTGWGMASGSGEYTVVCVVVYE
jgi:hypothetical protein